jgi:hypothetical protein
VRRKLIVAGAAAGLLAVGGAGAAMAVGGDDGDSSLTRPTADKAIAAALEATGGGTANAVERDGEKGATYEVEVRKTDGSTVDVRLDANYELVVIDSDSESTDDGGAESGD